MRAWPWFAGGAGSTALGLVLLALPARWEGPTLLPIAPGHALSVLDSVALVPLLAGTAWLYAGLWRRRRRLSESIRRSPGAGSAALFAAGLGVGLLLASGLSSFWWWWAIGAVLYGAMLVVALVAAA